MCMASTQAESLIKELHAKLGAAAALLLRVEDQVRLLNDHATLLCRRGEYNEARRPLGKAEVVCRRVMAERAALGEEEEEDGAIEQLYR